MANLPKWPAVAITGKAISPDLAFEVILRTDHFLTDFSEYGGGNNHKWIDNYRRRAGLKSLHKESDPFACYRAVQRVREKLKVLPISYFEMDWASSCYVGGPSGWCSESGEISFFKNIGKWPSQESIEDELTLIAQSFPFLEMEIAVYDGEISEDNITPILSYEIKQGLMLPLSLNRDLRPFLSDDMKEDVMEKFRRRLQQGQVIEQGLSEAFIDKVVQRVANTIEIVKQEIIEDERAEKQSD